jgi:hypothetical protein
MSCWHIVELPDDVVTPVVLCPRCGDQCDEFVQLPVDTPRVRRMRTMAYLGLVGVWLLAIHFLWLSSRSSRYEGLGFIATVLVVVAPFAMLVLWLEAGPSVYRLERFRWLAPLMLLGAILVFFFGTMLLFAALGAIG